MSEIYYVIEEESFEIEHIENLLCVLGELMDEIPEDTDKERAWKLECFCKRQGMTRAVETSLNYACSRLKEKNEKLLNMVDTM